jgi:hypothetical protein
MFDIFMLKLILSFVVGGLWITAATVIAERKGTKLGGLIVALPSTSAIGLFFIAWANSLETSVQATTIMPVIGGINCLFTLAFIFLLRKNFGLAILGSLAVWFAVSFSFALLGFNSFFVALLIYAILLLVSYNVLEKKLRIKSESRRKVKYTFSMLLFRGLLGGGVISFAVIMSKVAGPLYGGMFSMFPAMFLSTMVLTYVAHGASFSSGTLKSAIIGSISIVAYAPAVRYTYLSLGLLWGTIVSILVSYALGVLVYYLWIKRMK